MTTVTKNGRTMRISGDAQISAFINSGWQEILSPAPRDAQAEIEAFENMTKAELLEYAKENGIAVKQIMSKAEIFEMIRGH